MKYWLLTTEFPPFHGGGISTYCQFTVRMLAEAGHAVTVFVPDDDTRDTATTQPTPGVTLVRFNSNREKLFATLGHATRLSHAFAGIVRQHIERYGKPDVIESQDYLGIAYYLTQFKHLGYAFMTGVPVVLTLHSPAFIYLEYNRAPTFRFPDYWTGEMEKQSINAADALIAPTRFIAEEVHKYVDLSAKAVHFLPNPYALPSEIAGGHFTKNKILYYGKLSPQKGSFALLEYFKQLWDDGFAHSLHMIGGTDIVYHPEMKTMGQLVAKNYAFYIAKGLLKLHGKINPSQIKTYLQDAHVVIVPSLVDNLPYVIMEAMGMGKLVLASVQGGQKEMIEDGVTGFLFDHREPSSFCSQLKKMLSLSPEDVLRIGSNAVTQVRQSYAFVSVVGKKTAILQQVMAAGAGDKKHFPFVFQEPPAPLPDVYCVDSLLSVVIPYYNMENYLDACIQSVMDSSYKNIALLVVNDGSTDPASIEKLAAVALRPNIRVIHQPNQGLAATRNLGAEAATGEYLAFLDADDKVHPAYFEKAIIALQRNDNVYFAGAWVQYFENSSSLWPAFTPQPPYALLHNPVNSSGLVYKRKAFLAGGLNDKRVDYGLEDYESVVNLLHHGFNGVVLPEALFYYRVRTGSMFRNITREKLLYANQYIATKHQAYYARFFTQLVNLLNANGPGYLFDNPTFPVSVTSRNAAENVVSYRLKTFLKSSRVLKGLALRLRSWIKR